MSNLPPSPDLQVEAERVFAHVQRAFLVEDAKAVIAKALRARDERAARIADAHLARVPGHHPDHEMQDLVSQGYGNAALNIAHSIRAGA